MNAKIRELIKQHGVNITIDGLGYGEGNVEGLAELIVRECINKIETHQITVGDSATSDKELFAASTSLKQVRDKIKQHFGVEE